MRDLNVLGQVMLANHAGESVLSPCFADHYHYTHTLRDPGVPLGILSGWTVDLAFLVTGVKPVKYASLSNPY